MVKQMGKRSVGPYNNRQLSIKQKVMREMLTNVTVQSNQEKRFKESFALCIFPTFTLNTVHCRAVMDMLERNGEMKTNYRINGKNYIVVRK